MRVALISENFYPVNNSGATQLWDLAVELGRQGIELTVFTPVAGTSRPIDVTRGAGFQICRVKCLATKDVGMCRRLLAESVMPFISLWRIYRSQFKFNEWNAVIWYSPSIFWGPLVYVFKSRSHCPSYLILRDIFPEWAIQMGLIRNPLLVSYFQAVAKFQYRQADIIGCQANGDRVFIEKYGGQHHAKLELLDNWLSSACLSSSPITSDNFAPGKKVFIYAGNMGIAQNLGKILDLAERFRERSDVLFLFVGGGSEKQHLVRVSDAKKLNNVMFQDEMGASDVRGLLRACDIGIVSLDPRLKTSNIPGKFLTYLREGLPTLAIINEGNDLAELITKKNVGSVCVTDELDTLVELAQDLLGNISIDSQFSSRCKSLFESKFDVKRAATQIIESLDLQYSS